MTNGIADSTALRTISGFRSPSPSTLGSQVRLDVFEKLFVEFEAILLSSNLKGHAWVDENRIGSIRELHRKLQPKLKMQPLAPIGVSSKAHHAVQLADVCAYFMLMQVRPNGTVPASATTALNEIAELCPDPVNAGYALIHFV